jgi:CTP synthase (UTP-ammonia lyase)
LGIPDADTAEHNPATENIVISPVACAVENRPEGAPKLFGACELRVRAGSRLHLIYGRERIREEYFCNYEVNPEYEKRLEAAGLPVVARGSQGEARAVEMPGRRFFLATLYQPQLSSKPGNPHPVIIAFLGAAGAFKRARAESIAQSAR